MSGCGMSSCTSNLLTVLVAASWTCFSLDVFLVFEAGVQKLGMVLEVWSHEYQIKGNDEFSQAAGFLLCSTQLAFFTLGLCCQLFSSLPTQVFSAESSSSTWAPSHGVLPPPSWLLLNFMRFLSAQFSSL